MEVALHGEPGLERLELRNGAARPAIHVAGPQAVLWRGGQWRGRESIDYSGWLGTSAAGAAERTLQSDWLSKKAKDRGQSRAVLLSGTARGAERRGEQGQRHNCKERAWCRACPVVTGVQQALPLELEQRQARNRTKVASNAHHCVQTSAAPCPPAPPAASCTTACWRASSRRRRAGRPARRQAMAMAA